MTMLTRIRHRIGKWLWKENEWTKAVEEIEAAVKVLQSGEKQAVHKIWAFTFLPKPNVIKMKIELASRPE